MTGRDRIRWEFVVSRAVALIADPERQSIEMWRPDLRAILAANLELARLQKQPVGKGRR